MTITPLQLTHGGSSGTTSSFAKAFTSNVTAGSLLVVAGGIWFTGALNASGPTDTQGLTWTLRGSSVGATAFWTATAASSGACTVTLTPAGGANYMMLGLAELPMCSSFGSAGRKSSSGTTHTTNNFVPTGADAILFGLVLCSGNPSGSITTNGAWTDIGNVPSFANLPYAFSYRTSAAGTFTADWTFGASISSTSEGVAIWDPVGGGLSNAMLLTAL